MSVVNALVIPYVYYVYVPYFIEEKKPLVKHTDMCPI